MQVRHLHGGAVATKKSLSSTAMGAAAEGTRSMTIPKHRYTLRSALFFALAAIVALAVMRWIPAFQSPDEMAHLHRADMIAHGQLLLQKDSPDARGNTGGHADLHLIRFGVWMAKITGLFNKSDLSANALMEQASRHGWAHTEHFVDAMGSAYNVPLIYLPHAIGLGVSRQVDLSLRASYELTRTIVTLTTLALMAWAWTLLPPNLLTRALVVLPMSVFQILSPTVDGLCMALALLLLALSVVQYQGGPGHARAHPWHTLALYLCTFLLATSRANLLPLLALPLLLLWRDYSRPRLLAFIALCMACAGWTLFVLLTTVETRIERSLSTLQIIEGYARHPLEFFTVVANTLRDEERGYFIAYSFIGILGWLDTLIPAPAMKALWCILLATLAWTALQARHDRRDAPLRIVLLACAVVSALLVFFALAVTWNGYPVPVLGGVQGRYFMISALLVAVAVGPLPPRGRSVLHRRVELAASAAIAAYCLYVLVSTLSARYQMQVF